MEGAEAIQVIKLADNPQTLGPVIRLSSNFINAIKIIFDRRYAEIDFVVRDDVRLREQPLPSVHVWNGWKFADSVTDNTTNKVHWSATDVVKLNVETETVVSISMRTKSPLANNQRQITALDLAVGS